jgi:hypothetical protein
LPGRLASEVLIPDHVVSWCLFWLGFVIPQTKSSARWVKVCAHISIFHSMHHSVSVIDYLDYARIFWYEMQGTFDHKTIETRIC